MQTHFPALLINWKFYGHLYWISGAPGVDGVDPGAPGADPGVDPGVDPDVDPDVDPGVEGEEYGPVVVLVGVELLSPHIFTSAYVQ